MKLFHNNGGTRWRSKNCIPSYVSRLKTILRIF